MKMKLPAISKVNISKEKRSYNKMKRLLKKLKDKQSSSNKGKYVIEIEARLDT